MVGLAAEGISIGTSLYSAYNGSKKSNSGGGPSGGAVQQAFGSPPQIYSRNPDWVNDASQSNYNNAAAAANRPYQPYTGEMVAGRGDNQKLAAQIANDAPGRFQDTYNNATNYINSSANPNNNTYTPGSVGYSTVGTQDWNADQANKYMSPYLQTALNPQIQNINQQYAQQQNAANARAAGSGNFGGSRQGVENALINKQQNQDIQNVEAQGYNTAYNTGLGAFQTAQQQGLQAQQANQAAGINTGEYNQGQNAAAFNTNQALNQQNKINDLNAANALTGLTTVRQNNQNAILNNLQSTGAVGQGIRQNQDTANYQNFQNQFYYPQQQATYLQSILGSPTNAGSLQGMQGVLGNNGINNAVSAAGNSGLLGGIGNALGGMFGGSGGGDTSSFAGGAAGWVNPDTMSIMY